MPPIVALVTGASGGLLQRGSTLFDGGALRMSFSRRHFWSYLAPRYTATRSMQKWSTPPLHCPTAILKAPEDYNRHLHRKCRSVARRLESQVGNAICSCFQLKNYGPQPVMVGLASNQGVNSHFCVLRWDQHKIGVH